MFRYPGLEIVLQEEEKDMSDKNTLYLECRSGISGDMTVAALLDLGATEENLRRTLAKLPVGGYEIKVQRLIKNGLEVCDFDVILEEEAEHSHEHGQGSFGFHAYITQKSVKYCMRAGFCLARG